MKNTKDKIKTVSEGDWGSVRIIKGKHKGKLGYYDDDEENKAIVYLGEPFLTEPVYIKREWLISVDSLSHEKWKKDHAEFVTEAGIT